MAEYQLDPNKKMPPAPASTTLPVAKVETPETKLAQSLQMSPNQIALIKRTVAKDATNDELAMFIHLSKKYKLDPFAKEIFFIKRSEKDVVMMTSRDGYLKIAQADPNFDGIQSGVVRQGDEFQIDTVNNTVVHKFAKDRTNIIGAWAIVRHKGRTPAICFVEFAEYDKSQDKEMTSRDGKPWIKKGSPTWKEYPSAMIQKVAEAFALKRQFGISGLVTQEEMGQNEKEPVVVPPSDTPSLPEKTETIEETTVVQEEVDLSHPTEEQILAGDTVVDEPFPDSPKKE